MATIGTLAVNIIARVEKFTGGLTKARRGLAGFGNAISGALGSLNGFVGMLGAGLTVGGFVAGIKSTISSVSDLVDRAGELGIATDALASLRHAVEMSGESVPMLESSLMRLQKVISEAKMGIGNGVRAFDQLGLSVNKLSVLSPDKQFGMIADALNKIEDPTERARLAMDLFGKSGGKLLNTISLGSEGLAKYAEDARFLGLAIGPEMAAKVEEAGDALERMEKSLSGLFIMLTVNLAPAITDFSNSVATGMSDARGSVDGLTDSVSGFAKAWGVVLDVFHTIKIVFKGLQSLITSSLAFWARRLADIEAGLNKLAKLSNEVLGTNLQESTFFDSLASSMTDTAQKLSDDWWKLFLGKTPSEKIAAAAQKWGKAISDGLAKAVERIPAIDPVKFLPDAAALDPALIHRISNRINEAIAMNEKLSGIGDSKRTVAPSSFALARSGSAESYRQQAAIRGRNDEMKKIAAEQLKVQKAQAQSLENIDKHIMETTRLEAANVA